MNTSLARRTAAAVLFAAATLQGASAGAQNPTVQQVIPEAATETLHGRIIALNRETRQVILITPGGRVVSAVALPQIPLTELKLFDTVNMTYHRSVAFFVSPDANAPPDASAAILASPVQGPGGAALRMTRISAMVVGVHPGSNSVDAINAGGGGVVTVHIHDSARIASLASLKPGDTVTAVVTESLVSAIQPARALGT